MLKRKWAYIEKVGMASTFRNNPLLADNSQLDMVCNYLYQYLREIIK